MGRKIFVSYKYADSNVQNLYYGVNSTVRDYVTEFEKLLDRTDHIYKGESDGEDLSKLSEDTIWSKLKDRIYDSSITIVFISPNMRETWKKDKEQWIPWEISYSLKEINRKDSSGRSITSLTNAMIAVVLPDSNGSYQYHLEDKGCCNSHCITHHTEDLFQIIRDNMFNKKNPNTYECQSTQSRIWSDQAPSYIGVVKWCNFKSSINYYLDAAYERQCHIDDYIIIKAIEG